MTVYQIKIALAIRDYGSISNASHILGLTQPNASYSIKQLEAEIGFEIFRRSKTGVTITEKGNYFLEHAERLLKEHNSIMDIKNFDRIYRLRVGAVNYLSAAEPFLKLCEQHRDDEITDFRFYNVSVKEGIEYLYNYDLDIVFSPVLKNQIPGLKKSCDENNLEMISLGKIPAVISVRKDHPAIADGSCINITQGSNAMKNYPYVAYRNLADDSGPTGYNDINFVPSSYVIYVDEVSVRLRTVASTNGFCFGITPSRGVCERHNLVSFPVSGVSLDVFCLIRKSEPERKEILEYISLLKEELNLVKNEK